MKHLIGSDDSVLSDIEQSWQPEDVNITEKPPEGKTDLFVSMDFRMTSSGLFSDIILPAATWYEKYDISSTDLHPFVHPFNAAISPRGIQKVIGTASEKLPNVFLNLLKSTCLHMKT